MSLGVESRHHYYLKLRFPKLAAHWNCLESLKNTDAWVPLQRLWFNYSGICSGHQNFFQYSCDQGCNLLG